MTDSHHISFTLHAKLGDNEFVDDQPAFDADELDALIEQASPKWADVPDTNAWLDQIRNDANES